LQGNFDETMLDSGGTVEKVVSAREQRKVVARKAPTPGHITLGTLSFARGPPCPTVVALSAVHSIKWPSEWTWVQERFFYYGQGSGWMTDEIFKVASEKVPSTKFHPSPYSLTIRRS
jgi:hypothetical protein